jgi:hypothetical protein
VRRRKAEQGYRHFKPIHAVTSLMLQLPEQQQHEKEYKEVDTFDIDYGYAE